jgi:hypothetical protein
MVLLSIMIAALLFVMTTMIHAGGMTLAVRTVRKEEEHWGLKQGKKHVFIVCEAVLMMFLVSLLEVLAYTVAYLALNALPSFEVAFYFSMVTFTTLGYGDVLLDENWRLLASFQAANGIIMFGWTTAVVIYVVQRVYFSKESTG